MANARTPTRPLKILMLHGYTQSGPLFRSKTRALEKNLAKAFPAGVTLSYPTAPIRLSHSDVSFDTTTNPDTAAPPDDNTEPPDAWAWWRRGGTKEPFMLEGLETGLAHIAEVLKTEGPFDGVVGFSQGGAAAGLVASLLETGRVEAFAKASAAAAEGIEVMKYPASFLDPANNATGGIIHPPFKFAVSYSGFCAGVDHPAYVGFYQPKIQTQMQHFLGSLDTVVSEERSLKLVQACENSSSEGRVVYHPGGHFLPSSQKQYVAALIGFIKEILAAEENAGKAEESVEDMDVPF